MSNMIKKIIDELIVETDKRSHMIYEIIQNDSNNLKTNEAILHIMDSFAARLQSLSKLVE